jgi:hypothetical protein
MQSKRKIISIISFFKPLKIYIRNSEHPLKISLELSLDWKAVRIGKNKDEWIWKGTRTQNKHK